MLNCCFSEMSLAGGRAVNEDRVFTEIVPRGAYALLADGLGGQGCGEIAAQLAIDGARDVLRDCGRLNERALREAFSRANQRVLGGRRRMGNHMLSTLAAVLISGTHAHIAHVGDSRVYCFRQGEMIYQTADHSIPQLMVNSGELSPGEIRGHASRNLLTKAVGEAETMEAEVHRARLRRGDRLLLCSDGFWELVFEEEMAKASAALSADAWLEEMRMLALRRMPPNADNLSAIALSIE